jgi:homoserine kinase type II
MESVQSLFNLKVEFSEEVNRGWLNLKWKIKTNRGDFLVKQFS